METAALRVENLSPDHDVKSFTCGDARVDDFLHNQALAGEYEWTWVVVPTSGSTEIIAFYTVDPDPILSMVDDEFNETPVPYVDLQMIGVDVKYQRRGICRRLIMRLIRQVLSIADLRGVRFIDCRAIDFPRKALFLGMDLGFTSVDPESLRMILPVDTIRQISGATDIWLPPSGF